MAKNKGLTGFLIHIANVFGGFLKMPFWLAMLFIVVVPVFAYASGIFTFIGSLFSNPDLSEVKTVNSQTIALLEAPNGPVGFSGGHGVSIVGGTSLSVESPDPTASSTPAGSDQISVYVVHQGDTLSAIAQMFGVSKNTIIWANDIKNGKVSPGDRLVILPISGVEYTVKSGDTIKSIAKKFKADADEIASFNNITLSDKLSIGDTLIIPDGEISSSVGSSSYSNSNTSSSGSVPSASVGSRGPSTPVYIGYYMRPITGGIKTQGVHGHNGVDLASYYGAPIMASADGTVIIAKNGGWNGGYGSYVVIKHDNGTQTLYGHLSNVTVTAGQVVVQGQVIGNMGSSGQSTGTHLHFEVRGARNPF